MTTEPPVTAEQVAQHLGVFKDTAYRWRERKSLPARDRPTVEIPLVRGE